MLPISFFGQNLNYATNLLFSLAAFATFWLYFDAWLVSKKKEEITKWLGFALLAASFLLQAVVLDSSIASYGFWHGSAETILVVSRILGYGLIINTLLRESVQKAPQEGSKVAAVSLFALPATILNFVRFIFAPAAFLISFLYFRRATVGLERHLKRVALAFLALGLSEFFLLAVLLRETKSIDLYNAVAPYGVVWFLQQLCLIIATILLGSWVWSYLTKRIQSQLYIIFTSGILIVTLVISSSLSFLLFRSIEKNSLTSLETATNVLSYSLDSKKSELSAIAEATAKNPEIKKAILSSDHETLVKLVQGSLTSKKINSLIVTSKSGLVLVRAEEPTEWGDSISSDSLIKRALSGTSVSDVTIKESANVPVLNLQSAQALLEEEDVIGSVIVSLTISNNFLDGIKDSTGLDASVYADNIRSATTLLSRDQKSRFVGNREENPIVKKQVLEKGKTFSGNLSISNQPFLAVYQPLKNSNNQVVGMLFAGQAEVEILRSAAEAIEQVFTLSIILLLISIAPSYFIARSITKQLH